MARCAKKSTDPKVETPKEKTTKKKEKVDVKEESKTLETKTEKAKKASKSNTEKPKVESEAKKVKKTAKVEEVLKEEVKNEKVAKKKSKKEEKPVEAFEEPKVKEEESVEVKVENKSNDENIIEVMSPTRKMKTILGYSQKDLNEFKEIILQKREEIIEQLQMLKEQMMDPATGQYVNENSPYSLHMAEQGTDAQEREKLYLWAQRENKFLGYLEDALVRIENRTYGICIECIDEPQNLCPTCPLIPKERLKAVPHTQHCLQVKTKMQKK